MSKLKELAKSFSQLSIFSDTLLCLYALYVIKLLLIESNYASSINLLVIASIYLGKEYLVKMKQDNLDKAYKANLERDLEEIKAKLNRVNSTVNMSNQLKK